MKKRVSMFLAFTLLAGLFQGVSPAARAADDYDVSAGDIIVSYETAQPDVPTEEPAETLVGDAAEKPVEAPAKVSAEALVENAAKASFAEPGAQAANKIAEANWDLLNADMADYAKTFKITQSSGVGTVTQKTGYINIFCNTVATSKNFVWVSPTSAPVLPKDGPFTVEMSVRLAGDVADDRANELSVRVDTTGKYFPIFLKYGDSTTGGVTNQGTFSGTEDKALIPVDTTKWHNYALVIDPVNKGYTVYVDGTKCLDIETSGWGLTGADMVRVGADNKGRCNMDVQSMRVGTGDLSAFLGPYDGPEYAVPQLTKAQLSAPTSQDENEAGTVTVTVTGSGCEDGANVSAKLVKTDGVAVDGVTASGTIQDNSVELTLNIPVEKATVGTYYVEASMGDSKVRSDAYTIRAVRMAPTFPTFAAVGYAIEMADYIYNPTQEFNFPTIVDTKDHPVNNDLGNYRYYLFYAPHDAPAGNCVAASNSLDGPWVEYEANPVISKDWDGNYNVSHVSSPYVMWLEEQSCYIMYFHGENTTTRYATSTDLLNWTYGGVCVTANQFSTTGSGFSEASYAKVYQHEVPGLDNKYIMLLMITGSGNNMHRNIYWAHSKDGITWTPVQKSLLNPDIDPQYKNNFSGPWFQEQDGRYFVICHASSGEIYVFEVGQALDECIEWGEVYNSQGIRGTDDANPESYPDYGRAGAPFFIQDDAGRWHMFYEAGKRLNTNIVHAVEVRTGEEEELARAGLELASDAPLSVGEQLNATLRVFDKANNKVASTAGMNLTYHVSDPKVIAYENGVITALGEGTATAWVEVEKDGVSVRSSSEAVTVMPPEPLPPEVILTNEDTDKGAAMNLELPAVFKAKGVLEECIDNYYLYFSYNDAQVGGKGIALATASKPEGPWTVYNGGAPILTIASLGASGIGEVNAPWPIWDSANSRMLMYYSMGEGAIGVASSTDGVTFTNLKTVLDASALAYTTVACRQSVYEYAVSGKDNKYVMLFTGSANGDAGRQIFYACSNDGLTWESTEEPLRSPDSSGDKGAIASPRLLVKDGSTYLVYHNNNGNLGWAALSEDFGTTTGKGRYYKSAPHEPDRGKAADAAFLTDGSKLYLYYTARSSNQNIAEAASVLVCRRQETGQVFLQNNFNDGSSSSWTAQSGEWSVKNGAYVQHKVDSQGYMTFAGNTSWTDYEFEVKVTPLAYDKKLSVMLSGRADGAGNRYVGSYNDGKLTINRRVNNADKVLASGNYEMVVGTTYTMKMVFEGDHISLYINGEKLLETTDSTHSSGKVGFVTYQTSAKFDDVVVRAVSHEDEEEKPLTMAEFDNYQVIQRDPKAQNAIVTVHGTVADPAAKVELRVVKFDDGTVVNDWTAAAKDPSEEKRWSGEVTVPQGGWYRLEARTTDGTGKVLETVQGSHKWGVGINILCIGQSNMVGQAPETPRTEAVDLVANYTRSGRWGHLVDPYDGAGGSLVPALGNALVAKLGIPIGFVPAADSGSGLHGPNPFTNPPHAANRYWMYLNEKNHSDTATLYGKAITRAKAAGGVELAVWNQGETDGGLMIAKQVYESDMRLLLSRLRDDLGDPSLPIFLCQIGTHDPNISNDTAYTEIRSAQHDLDDGENFFLAATEMEFERKDTAHYKKAGMDEIGRRVANSILYYYGESDYYRGPYIVSADYADETRQVVDVTIAHRGGSDITPQSGITGFDVWDNTAKATIASAERKDATTIRLTLSAPISGSGSVRYLFGLNPPHTNIVKDNTSLALPLENTTEALMIGNDEPVRWDILDHDMYPTWADEGFRSSSKTGSITQESDYVNINKPNESAVGTEKLYHWVISPAGLALPRSGFTMETTVRVADEVDAEANEIAIRMGTDANDLNGKIASVFLGHGEDGYVSASGNGAVLYRESLDTTQWHKLTFVVFPNDAGEFYFDLYVDDELTFDTVPFTTYKGGDLIRFGADNGGRCDMDVKDVRVGSGVVLPEGVSGARITGVSLSAESQLETEEKTVTVTVLGPEFEDDMEIAAALVDSAYRPVAEIAATGAFQNGAARMELAIPAGLKVNRYYVQVTAENRRKAVSPVYQITSNRPAPKFPTFEPKSYTIELEDYIYNPTQEFNFPSVVDTKDHPVNNAFGNNAYRYYLFYAPHDAPAGNCVAVSNSLDGPWVEYSGNPVVGKTWPKEDGSGENYYSVSHVSSPHVTWNEEHQCWFMYFHGENPITRYATSDDLLNWTYGGECVHANDFSPLGSGLGEASYARVYEHEVPGLGNKYIMLIMISGTGSFSAKSRYIYWAHSTDAIHWTAVQTPLLDPNMDPQYMSNFSGPWFMEWEVEGETRYFVICHASSGEIYAFEVGQALDELIPWGILYESRGQRYDSDRDDDAEWPDYGRAGAPCFIQDDDGVWHMFYEGGKRLHANIVHAVGAFASDPMSITASPTTLTGGGCVTLTLANIPAEQTATVTCPGITVTGSGDTWTAILPNATAEYTFTAMAGEQTASCTVQVTKHSFSGSTGDMVDTGKTTKNPDGSVTTTKVNRGTGTVTATTKYPDGSKTTTVTRKDGSVETTQVRKDGVTVTAKTDASGGTTADVVIPGKLGKVTVTIPASQVTGTTVAVIVHDDGVREIIKNSLPAEGGLAVTLTGSVCLELLDNAKEFVDVPADYWAHPAVNFVTARELFNGTAESTFAPTASTTRAMLMTVLARLGGVDTSGGATWYEKGVAWAVETGVSDGRLPEQNITREQLVTMLWRYSGKPAHTLERLDFTDASEAGEYAVDALLWAVETGIVQGKGNGILDPLGIVTRAEVAQILKNYMSI